jgi:probable DNA repair protein
MSVDLFATVAAGGVVLTANKRLARHLVEQFDQAQLAAGRSVWPSPAILSLDAWLMRQIQQQREEHRLLTESQAQRIWEEIVGTDAAAAGRDLLQVPQAARRAREAHRLLQAYLADFTASDADEDQLAFLRWRKRSQERMHRDQLLERADLLALVTAAIAAGRGAVPSVLALAGFDDLTPAVHQLCVALEARGCRVGTWDPPFMASAEVSVHAAIDMAAEVRSCARWVRRRLERNPQARIGVVAPQLADYQGLIERIFRAELDPSACLRFQNAPETFTLSLGTPLAREGVVRAALRLLAAGDPLRLEDVGWLLRSPYLGAQGEWLDRSCADRRLRERGRSEWPLAALPKALAGVPRTAAVFDRLRQTHRDRRRRLPGAWAEYFVNLLVSCDWPGQRGLTSREFQALDHFQLVLGQLASLDRVTSPMGYSAALVLLNRLAAETVFQPEGVEGRIQVLGMLEAAGFAFDALWVLGLHAGAFPPPPRPNPFLPLPLQSRLRMPHADAAREREFAERLSRRLFSAAPEVLVSWPAQRDGAPLRPSPLLEGLVAADLELAPSCDPFRAMLAAPCLLEELVDDRAAPLSVARPSSGGTGILKDQALCPFRAFAHHRLHAEGLAAATLGLDHQTRGSLVHGVLEHFWRQVVSHAALLAIDRQRQAELLTGCAEQTVQQFERRSQCDLPPRLRALECRRLAAIGAAWLELERRRPPFRVVAIEQRHDAAAGRLQLRTRIDRLDELPGGQLAVIDYKTGRPNPRQWFDLRVTEPQLPLYCLALDEQQLAAVLFAQVRPRERECAFKCVAREPEAWPKLSSKGQARLLAERGWGSFAELLNHWRAALPALGNAFSDGFAAVDPVDPLQACQSCDLVTLCRISAALDRDEQPEGEGSADE